MPSQFFGLNIAYRGLLASNAALNTTGHNISNARTNGYSRQKVNQQASEALRTFTSYGSAGAGVDVISIERIRNKFYDVRFQQNRAKFGEYDAKKYYMKQMEDYFADDEITVGFNSIFNEMYKGLEDLKNSPGDSMVKTQFIGFANNLAQYFNNMSNKLEKMQTDANAEIKIQVDQINSLAEKISSLNGQINTIEMSGSIANDLRDQRDLLLDELSQIVDIETSETPVYDLNQPSRHTGANNFIVRIAGGQTLVNSEDYNRLECVARTTSEKINQSDADGLYDIQWDNGMEFNLTNGAMGGTLKGLIQLRDGNNGEYFSGKIAEADPSRNTIKVEVTADYLKDIAKCTLSDTGGKITIGNQDYLYDSWTYEYDASTGKYFYNFQLSNNNTSLVSSDRIGKEASVGYPVKYQGVPYYMEQMNEWARQFSKVFNDIVTQKGAVGANGKVPEFLFKANKEAGSGQYEFKDSYPVYPGPPADPNNFSYTISSSGDSYYRLTAKNFAVNTEMIKDPDLLATHTGGGDESENSNIVDQLIKVNSSKDMMNFRGGYAGGFLQCIHSDVALNAGRANNFYSNFDTISDTIDTMRISISGVDEDEETVNLVKYQNSYTLASKMIQTLTEVYDRLILNTGV